MTTPVIKPARLGPISEGTLRTEDLLTAFLSELESLVLLNGEFFALPENRSARDRLSALVGEAQDAFADDGETLKDEEAAAEIVNELQDTLSEWFAPAYAVFGAHEGDGACFGFWPNVESAKEDVCFVSHREISEETSQEDASYPPDDFRGEWLHVSDHGNCTLYVREDCPMRADGAGVTNFTDREIWSVV